MALECLNSSSGGVPLHPLALSHGSSLRHAEGGEGGSGSRRLSCPAVAGRCGEEGGMVLAASGKLTPDEMCLVRPLRYCGETSNNK